MTSMLDLPPEIVGNIFSRVPITCLRAVRCTCKSWNSLSNEWIVGEATKRQQFLGFMTRSSKLYSVRFDLHGSEEDDLVVEPYIKQVALFDTFKISKVFHIDGLVLLVTRSRLVAWNPYLKQQRWIEPRRKFRRFEHFGLGYDQNHNHKILRITDGYDWRVREGFFYVMILCVEHAIYDFSSDTWRVLDVTPNWNIDHHHRGVTLKGNTYFLATEKNEKEERNSSHCFGFLLSFDYTKEGFGPRLALPFHSYVQHDTVTLSCISQERLAILRQKSSLYEFLDIWVTDKIEPNAVSWNKFFTVDTGQQIGFRFHHEASFFVDEEKKLAVVFDTAKTPPHKPMAYIIGEDGYFKSVTFGGSMHKFSYPSSLVSPFYLPSLLQIKQKRMRNRKRKKTHV